MAVHCLWMGNELIDSSTLSLGSELFDGSTLSVNGQWTYWWQYTVCEWAVNLLKYTVCEWVVNLLKYTVCEWAVNLLMAVHCLWMGSELTEVHCEEASSWDDPVQLAGCWNPMTNQLWVCMVLLKWNMHGADPWRETSHLLRPFFITLSTHMSVWVTTPILKPLFPKHIPVYFDNSNNEIFVKRKPLT